MDGRLLAVAQEGSGGFDGLSSAAEENEEASSEGQRSSTATSRKFIVYYSGS